MFPWKVQIALIESISVPFPDPKAIPWLHSMRYDMRDPFRWCRQNVGGTAILGSTKRYGRYYTKVQEHGDAQFASVGPTFWFRDQTMASAFRLAWG
jgi:hypothetical protein